jgi:hypothetical protein
MRGKRDDGYAKGMIMDGGRVSQELEMPQRTGSRGTIASGQSSTVAPTTVAILRDLSVDQVAGEDGVPQTVHRALRVRFGPEKRAEGLAEGIQANSARGIEEEKGKRKGG